MGETPAEDTVDLAGNKPLAAARPAELHALGLTYLGHARRFLTEGDSQPAAEYAAVAQAFFSAARSASEIEAARWANQYAGHHG
jgi:hypothetical protein